MWLEACVKIKWICTEESSHEGGAQGLMKYIKIKQIETPTARNNSNVYTKMLIPT